MKKILSLTLCLCICFLFLCSCGLKEGENGAIIQVYMADFPPTMDPALVQANADTNRLLSMVFEPLTKIGDNGKVSGALAKKWYGKYDPVFKQFAVYFELNETVWSNGTAVSANDIVWSWKRILNPQTESPYAPLLYCIKNAKAVKSGYMTSDDLGLTAENDHLLKVVFEDTQGLTEEEIETFGVSPYIPVNEDGTYDKKLFEAACDHFAEIVANVHLSPVNENVVNRYTNYKEEGKTEIHQWGDYGAPSIVSNGPYKVQAFESGVKLVLERNAYYRYDEDNKIDKYVKPYRIAIYYYEGLHGLMTDESGLTEEQFQAKQFENGSIFYLGKFDKDTYAKYQKKLETANTTNGFAFLYNTKKITDASTRIALSAALNRSDIVKATGTGEIAATGYVPSGVFNTERKTDFRKVGGDLYSGYSMSYAKEQLGSVRSTLKLIYVSKVDSRYADKNSHINFNGINELVVEQAINAWAELGVKIEAEGMTYNNYIKALNSGNFDIAAYNVVMDSVDALAYLAPYATSCSGRINAIDYEAEDIDAVFTPGYTNLDDEEYNALIDRAIYTADPAKRAEILHEAEQKLNELCPATMVFYYTNSYVKSSKMGGIGDPDYFGNFDFTKASLSGWRKINAKESKAREEAEAKAKGE